MERANIKDPDARENWEFLLTLRDRLLAAGSIEAGYLGLVRDRVRLPHLFYDQLVQLILRNALEGCDDVHVLRAAEMFFRPQRAFLNDGALMLADDELVAELEGEIHSNPLFAMMNGGVDSLDVLNDENAWTYWSRSDAHTMVLPFGADRKARAGFAHAAERFVHHLLGQPVRGGQCPVERPDAHRRAGRAFRADLRDVRWRSAADRIAARLSVCRIGRQQRDPFQAAEPCDGSAAAG